MPLEWLVIMWKAMNDAFSGKWLPRMTFPAVTEFCRRQAAHSHMCALVLSA